MFMSFLGLHFSLQEIFSSFIVLFAIIDITGAIPIIIGLKQKAPLSASKVSVISFLILFLFMFVGDALLGLFNIDINSFAVAGAIILLILSAEMILDVEIFKSSSQEGASPEIVPMIFPLIAGAGTLTTILSLKSQFRVENISVAILMNAVVIFLVIRNVSIVEKIIGKNGIFVLRKFFGIILLAMSVRLFSSNIQSLFTVLQQGQ